MAVVVTVDRRESISRVPEELGRLGAAVRRTELRVADYDVGRGVLVERKSVPDLHLTLINGRYWRQIGRLRCASAWPVLLVEGRLLAAGPLGGSGIRGALLATAEQGVVVLRSDDAADSAQWLLQLASRENVARRDRPPYAQMPKRKRAEVAEVMLAAVPSISTATARALLREFKTVAGIVAAGPGAWARVPGVGEHRERELWEAFHARRPL
jgi:DNA excision repair protein ERCC-4